MKRIMVAALALLAPIGAWAQLPPPEYVWTQSSVGSTQAFAWAVKSQPEQGFPQVMVLGRDERSGAAAGERVRSSAMITFEVNCLKSDARVVEQTAYDAAFAQTRQRTTTLPWMKVSMLADGAKEITAFCAAPDAPRPQAKTATIAAAQAWLDATIPKPKPEPKPPVTSNFELVGRMSDAQPIDIWLDAGAIKREGNLATVWTFEAWEGGWMKLANGRMNIDRPATWRLHEIECGATLRVREIWRQQLGPAMTPANTVASPSSPFNTLTPVSDTNTSMLAQRVCNNRPLTFSATYAGTASQLAVSRYAAGEYVKVQAPRFPYPTIAQVDLGPTIRIRENDRTSAYEGTFTRSGTGNYYSGEFTYESGQKTKANLAVKGISDGMLLIDRSDREGDYAFPVSAGKAATGIPQWNRHRTDNTVTLLEPATITQK
jgi:hypothetical protein